MATERETLRALEGLSPTALERVKELALSLKAEQGSKHPSSSEREIARKQMSAIKKWEGKGRGKGFYGREHDQILYGGVQ